MQKKRKYITLRDRTWKGKEWWSSFGGTKFIRTLTDEEAATLDDIEEITPLLPLEENVIGEENGRMFCMKCDSKRGFYIYKMLRGAPRNWYQIFKCSDCGSRQKKMYWSEDELAPHQ